MLLRSLCIAFSAVFFVLSQGAAYAQGAEVTQFYQSVMSKIASQPRSQLPVYGETLLAFTVADDGALAAINVAKSSGNTTLDVTALNIVLSAAPFPAPPEGARRNLSITIKSDRPTLNFGDLDR